MRTLTEMFGVPGLGRFINPNHAQSFQEGAKRTYLPSIYAGLTRATRSDADEVLNRALAKANVNDLFAKARGEHYANLTRLRAAADSLLETLAAVEGSALEAYLNNPSPATLRVWVSNSATVDQRISAQTELRAAIAHRSETFDESRENILLLLEGLERTVKALRKETVHGDAPALAMRALVIHQALESGHSDAVRLANEYLAGRNLSSQIDKKLIPGSWIEGDEPCVPGFRWVRSQDSSAILDFR